jgi:aubergine-like protein
MTARTLDSLCYLVTGTSGRTVMLKANYFRLETHTDWCLYQYRVDFAPEEDRTRVRKALLRNHQAVLGSYIFDGTVMYTSRRLAQDVSKA